MALDEITQCSSGREGSKGLSPGVCQHQAEEERRSQQDNEGLTTEPEEKSGDRNARSKQRKCFQKVNYFHMDSLTGGLEFKKLISYKWRVPGGFQRAGRGERGRREDG